MSLNEIANDCYKLMKSDKSWDGRDLHKEIASKSDKELINFHRLLILNNRFLNS